MKTNTTYPTKHPHWIDEPEYLEAIKKKKRLGISFTTAFILVLAIHVAGVGGIFAFSKQKPKTAAPAKTEAVAQKPAAPKSDALARNEWPQPESKPKVVATPAPVKKQIAESKPAPKVEQKTAMAHIAAKPNQATAMAAIAKAAINPKPSTPKSDDSEKKKAFLATRTESKPITETRQAIPVAPTTTPLVASNTEAAAPITPAPVAVSKPVETIQPAPVAKAAPSAPRPSEYTLAAGDNLYMVSRKLQVSYNALMQANGLSDPRQLRVGQKLKVPTEQIASL
jgi:LysM repeat protein